MEKDIKSRLIESVCSIKKKIKNMKKDEELTNLSVNKILRPVVEPLHSLLKIDKHIQNTISQKEDASKYVGNASSDHENLYKTSASLDEMDPPNVSETSKNDDIIKSPTMINKVLERSLKKNEIADIYDSLNVPFGVRSVGRDLFMGNSKVKLSTLVNPSNNEKTNLINIENKQYELSSGLRELLFCKKPNLTLVTDKDQLIYKDMLYNTCAHRRDYNPQGQIRGDKSIKYRDIIKPLFNETELENNQKFGSVRNIDENNNIFSYGNDGKILHIPYGNYDLYDILAYLEKKLKDCEIKIQPNNNTLKCSIYCSETLNFNVKNSLGPVLGFRNIKLDANKWHESENPVRILPLSLIRIECDLVKESFVNGLPSHVLYEFVPDIPPGYRYIEVPKNIIYLPINKKNITSIAIKVVDEDGNNIDFRGENIQLRLHLRKIK
ncbi:unnamed protein product, partial [Brenthis ino]